MLPAIDPMTYERIPVSYDLIYQTLMEGGFNCDKDDDGDPIIITEKNMIVYCSLDGRTRSIMLYTPFFGEDSDQQEQEILADSLNEEYGLLSFIVRNGNLHVRIFISCISGLHPPELYLAAQMFSRYVNTLADDPRIQRHFGLSKNRQESQNDGKRSN